MSRSIWKPFSTDTFFIKREIFRYYNCKVYLKKKYNKMSLRRMSIPVTAVGDIIYIHKGNISVRFRVTKYTCGLKFGAFSFTRKPFFFPPKKKKKKFIKR